MSAMTSVATDSVREFFLRLGAFLPTLLGVFLILILGWAVAGTLQKVLVRMIKPWLDGLAEKLWIAEILRKGEVGLTLSDLCGVFLYWVVILATLIAALNALQLTEAARLLERVLAYVPNVLAGIIMLVLGLFFASLVGGLVQTAAANAGILQAKGLGQIARIVVILFAAVVAMEKFFSSMVLQTTFTIVIAAISFGFALAFGLGCKDLVGKMVADFVQQVKRR